jgi:hypothetical protein
MGISKITVNRGKGGLGRPLATNDHISGFVMPFTNANLPAGFSTTDRIKVVYSIADVETLGIVKAGTYTKQIWYHLNQFFKKQPDGKLYVNLIDDTSIDYASIETLQRYANGEIRQIAFYDPNTTFATGKVQSLQTSASILEGEDMPVSVIYSANTRGIANVGSFVDLRALNCKNVSVCIGEDGANEGTAIASATGKSLGCIGAVLGMVALSKVHENIGWVGQFNVVDGSEFDVPAISVNSASVLVKTISQSALNNLSDYGYIFLIKRPGYGGTFFNDAPTCVSVTSDYAYIESNRTIDKSVRNVRSFMLPFVNSPLYVNEDGTLDENTISLFKNEASRGLESMQIDGELSAYSVTINPAQNVLSTAQLTIAIKLVPVGVAREIVLNIGFALNI